MSETREIFTQRRKGVSQKEIRVKQHNEERKGKRHDLLLKRRIPNDAESDEEVEGGVKCTTVDEELQSNKPTEWEKSEQRRQQLLEWQAKRKAVKMEASKSKKAFVTGSKQPVLHLVPVSNAPLAPTTTNSEKCGSSKPVQVKSSTGTNTQQVSTTKRVTRSQQAVCEKPAVVTVPKSLKTNTVSDRMPVTTKQNTSVPEENYPPDGKPTTRKGELGTGKKECTVEKTGSGPAKGKAKDTVEKKDRKAAVASKKVGVAEKKEAVVEKKEAVVEKKEAAVEKKVGVVQKKEGVVEKKVAVVQKKVGVVQKKEAVVQKKDALAKKESVVERKGGVGEKGKAAGKRPTRNRIEVEVLEKGCIKELHKEPTRDVEDTTPLEQGRVQLCNGTSDDVAPCDNSAEEALVATNGTQDENQPPEQAWVPGYRATPKGKTPSANFSEVFGASPLHSFSPFRFMGAKTPHVTQERGGYAFTFRKTLPANPKDFVSDMMTELNSDMESDSLMETDGECNERGHEGADKDGEDCRKECVKNVHKMVCIEDASKDGDAHKMECVEDSRQKACIGDVSKEECVEGSTKAMHIGDSDQKSQSGDCKQGEEDAKSLEMEAKIAPFRKLHSDVVERLTSLCQQWEQRPTTSTIPEDHQEEVLGQIRTTVCQAQLLMKQKLKQYIQLVGQAEHGGGEQPTKVEDLQGFWDMVYFQVEDILKKFQGLESLEKNNWQAESELEPVLKKRKKCAAPPPAPKAVTEKQLAAREKREAARMKILELKALAVSKKEQDDESTGGDTTAKPIGTDASLQSIEPDTSSDGMKSTSLAGTDVASAVGCHVEEIHVSDSDQKSQSGDCKQSEEDAKRLEMEAKIAPFRKLHSDVVERLTSLCQQWEQRPTTSTIPEDHQEEVLGQIRTTVCQAQLLMKQKLKQYIQLVGQAEHGGGEQPTKVEDLQGFWDMVYFQVEDILKKFQGLESLEKNNWQAEAESELEPVLKKRKKCAAPPPAPKAVTEKQLAAREKREAARMKILELKALAVSKKEQDDESTVKPIGTDTSLQSIELDASCNSTKSTSLAGIDVASSVQCHVEEPSVPLMDFDTPVPNLISECNGSPPQSFQSSKQSLSPLPSALLRTPKKAIDVPTAQLLSITPARVMPSTPQKAEPCEGAFKKMYVAVTPSKRLRGAHPELTDDDVVMSEARRSVRLAHKLSHTPGRQVAVAALSELPEDLEYSFCPPSQL